MLRSQSSRAQSQRPETIPIHRQLAAASNNTVTIGVYSTSTCDSGTQVRLLSFSAGVCTPATDLIAITGYQDVQSFTVYCDASGPVYRFGYSDANCTKIVEARRNPSSQLCISSDYIRISCPANVTTPGLPLFPPAGFAVTTSCPGNSCTANCSMETWQPNVCRPVRLPGSATLYSTRSSCSSSSHRFANEVFTDADYGSLLFSSAGAVDSCYGYDYAAQSSCPAGVDNALPSFPPAHSVVTSQNCTNAICRQNCYQEAFVMGVCFRNAFNLDPILVGFANYCTNEGHVAATYFSDVSCTDSSALVAIADRQKEETCRLDGQTYAQTTCSYSPRQPQLPATLQNTVGVYNDNQCDDTTYIATLFERSNQCVLKQKLDCSNSNNPVLTTSTSTDCTAGVETFAGPNGACVRGARLFCASSATRVIAGLSHMLSVMTIVLIAMKIL